MIRNLSIAFLIILAAWLRIPDLAKRGIYTDEFFTLCNANGFWPGGSNQTDFYTKEYFSPQDFWQPKGIKDYFESIAHSDFGTHIVYNGILHVWMQVFGNDDFSVRILSVIFNILMIVLVYLLVEKIIKSRNTAFLAGLILAVDPLNVVQSHIARSYTLSFLLVVFATYLFLQIIKHYSHKIMILYAVIVALALLNHYLNFLVPLAHALVFLILKNKKQLWPAFIFAGIFNIIIMVWWFNWGGGYTAFEFLKDKNAKHLMMAKNNIDGGGVELSSVSIVVKKSIGLLFDTNVFTLNVFKNFKSFNEFLIACGIFLCLGSAYYFRSSKKYLISFGFFLIGLLGLTLFKSMLSSILGLILLFFVIIFMIQKNIDYYNKPEYRQQFLLLSICTLMMFIPILFVGFDALKNGHTTSLTKRYIGIGSPFVAIFMAVGVQLLIKNIKFAIPLLAFVVFYQYKEVYTEINDYLEDKSATYSWFQPGGRVKNPYKTLADNVIKKYNIGDTLVIPGGFKDVYVATFERNKLKTYDDAQKLNLYLPKNAPILQTIDATERNKVFIKQKNGVKIEIFNFEETKYRY